MEELNNSQKKGLVWTIIIVVTLAIIAIVTWGIMSTGPAEPTVEDTPVDRPITTATPTPGVATSGKPLVAPSAKPTPTPTPTPPPASQAPANTGAKMSKQDWVLFKAAGYCTDIAASHPSLQGVKAATFNPVTIAAGDEAVKCADGIFYTP